MNQKTIYEQTITGKLDQLPVPDMKETIWARIEHELNTDLPDGGDEPFTSPKPTTPRPWHLATKLSLAGTVLVVAAIIYTFFKQPAEPSPAPATTESQQQTDSIKNDVSPQPPPVTNNETNNSMAVPQKPAKKPVDPAGRNFAVIPDPLFQLPVPVVTDTVIKAPQIIFPRPDDKKPDSLPKPKGLKGISDDDYRINLKKDSVP